jgi:uncharacterized membrane protein
MNGAHLHLMFNHVPVIGLFCCLALLLAGQWRKNPDLVKAGLVALVIVALISIPVYLSGEPAEEIIEELPGISDDLIHAHEDGAIWAFIGLEVLGALALLGLVGFRPPKQLPQWLVPAVLVLGLLTMLWVGWVSALGGRIVHPESRPDFSLEAESGEHD